MEPATKTMLGTAPNIIMLVAGLKIYLYFITLNVKLKEEDL